MNNKELIGKVWYQNNVEQNEQKLLCFANWHCIYVNDKELHFASEDDGGSIVVYGDQPDTSANRYTIDYRDGTLTIKGNKENDRSLLVGEWMLAESGNETYERAETSEWVEKPDQGLETENWMARIPSEWNLRDICMPGTHVSAAYKCKCAPFRNLVLTQDKDSTIERQLCDGIRSFDLTVNENLNFFHGHWFLEQNLYQCLDTMKDFLSAHKSETIIITVRPENCENDYQFSHKMEDFVYIYRDLLYLEEELPNLGSVRGKIVLMRRFEFPYNRKLGIDMTRWFDDAIFEVYTPKNQTIRVQDRYGTMVIDKVQHIKNEINQARERLDEMHISYFSVTPLLWKDNEAYAYDIQHRVAQDGALNILERFRHNGIYMLDYYKVILPTYIYPFIHSNFVTG